MALAVNDVVQVTFVGSLFDQRILNVMHYAVTIAAGTTSVEGQLALIADAFAASLGGPDIKDKLLDATCPEYTLLRVRAQRVSPTRSVYRETLVGDIGLLTDTCTASNIAASITKRSNTPGRRGIGRWQLAGMGQSEYASGTLTPTYKTTFLTPLANQFVVTYIDPTDGFNMVPCIYNPTGTSPFFSRVTAASVQDEVRTMHRRTVRLGE